MTQDVRLPIDEDFSEASRTSDDDLPLFTLPVMQGRLDRLLPQLRDAKSSVDATESAEEIAHLSDVLDQLMKFCHDCTHSSRGCVRPEAAQRTILWFLDSTSTILQTLEELDLAYSDAFIDLYNERSMMSKHLVVDGPTSSPQRAADRASEPISGATIPEMISAQGDMVSDPGHTKPKRLHNAMFIESQQNEVDEGDRAHLAADGDEGFTDVLIENPPDQANSSSSFARGDVIVVKPKESGLEDRSFSVSVVSSSESELIVKKKRESDKTLPYQFTGELLEFALPDASGENTFTQALFNVVYVDQYKTAYGSEDMFYDGFAYYIRADHSLYGDFVFGRVIRGNNKRMVCAGILRTGNARPQWKLLTYNPESSTFSQMHIDKNVSVKAQDSEFCTPTESSAIINRLSEIDIAIGESNVRSSKTFTRRDYSPDFFRLLDADAIRLPSIRDDRGKVRKSGKGSKRRAAAAVPVNAHSEELPRQGRRKRVAPPSSIAKPSKKREIVSISDHDSTPEIDVPSPVPPTHGRSRATRTPRLPPECAPSSTVPAPVPQLPAQVLPIRHHRKMKSNIVDIMCFLTSYQSC